MSSDGSGLDASRVYVVMNPSPNVIKALHDLFVCAATRHNRRILTPWIYSEGSNSYCVYRLGALDPAYALYEKKALDDGTPVYEGQFLERGSERTLQIGTPEAFFQMVDNHIAACRSEIQLTVAEHREFLQFLRDTFPEPVFASFILDCAWSSYALRPLVGRTLASLTPAEVASLPDNLTLYALCNEGGYWWRTLGGYKPITVATLQADKYDGRKRISGFTVPTLVRSVGEQGHKP